MVGFFLGWWDVADGFEDASVVEPVDPFQNTEGEEWRSVPAQTLSILAAVLVIMIVVVPYFSSVFS